MDFHVERVITNLFRVTVFPDDAPAIVTTVETRPHEGEEVDVFTERWYDLNNVPQWLIDGLNEQISPVMVAINSKHS